MHIRNSMIYVSIYIYCLFCLYLFCLDSGSFNQMMFEFLEQEIKRSIHLKGSGMCEGRFASVGWMSLTAKFYASKHAIQNYKTLQRYATRLHGRVIATTSLINRMPTLQEMIQVYRCHETICSKLQIGEISEVPTPRRRDTGSQWLPRKEESLLMVGAVKRFLKPTWSFLNACI